MYVNFLLYLVLRFQVVRQIVANKDTSHKSPANFIIQFLKNCAIITEQSCADWVSARTTLINKRNSLFFIFAKNSEVGCFPTL